MWTIAALSIKKISAWPPRYESRVFLRHMSRFSLSTMPSLWIETVVKLEHALFILNEWIVERVGWLDTEPTEGTNILRPFPWPHNIPS